MYPAERVYFATQSRNQPEPPGRPCRKGGGGIREIALLRREIEADGLEVTDPDCPPD